MSTHASQAFSIAHCTDSEDLPSSVTHCDIMKTYITVEELQSCIKAAKDRSWYTLLLVCVHSTLQ